MYQLTHHDLDDSLIKRPSSSALQLSQTPLYWKPFGLIMQHLVQKKMYPSGNTVDYNT